MELLKAFLHGKKVEAAMADYPINKGRPYRFDHYCALGRIDVLYRKHEGLHELKHLELGFPASWAVRDLQDLKSYPVYSSRGHIRSAVTRYLDPDGLNLNLDDSVVSLTDFRPADYVELADIFEPEEVLYGSMIHDGSLLVRADKPNAQLVLSPGDWGVTRC